MTVDLTEPLIVLFLVFLVLKLTHVIAWSWLLVTLPLWMPFAVGAVIGSAVLVFTGLIFLLALLFDR